MHDTITNVQRYSLHDGGGIRTVAFLKGCPFRCPWCSNPENLSFAPQESLSESLCIHCSREPGQPCPRTPDECPTSAKTLMGESVSPDELTARLMRDRIFFEESGGGVTLSGGECLATPARQRFAQAVLAACKREGVRTAVETTLAVPLVDPSALVEAVDLFLVDFKVADRARSIEVTGIDPLVRDANLRAILGLGARVVARMPVIPGYTDSVANVDATFTAIAALCITRADVLPFHQLGSGKYDQLGMPYELASFPQLSPKDVAWVADRGRAAGIDVVVSGE